jgi:hypothetical protein
MSLCSTPFAAVYKRTLKEDRGFLGRFGFWLWLWALLWAFWCGKLLDGKRITEGKEFLKGNC